MIINSHNIGVNSELITSLLYQIYGMGRYRETGEDEIVPESSPSPTPPDQPTEDASFDMSFDDSFAI